MKRAQARRKHRHEALFGSQNSDGLAEEFLDLYCEEGEETATSEVQHILHIRVTYRKLLTCATGSKLQMVAVGIPPVRGGDFQHLFPSSQDNDMEGSELDTSNEEEEWKSDTSR